MPEAVVDENLPIMTNE